MKRRDDEKEAAAREERDRAEVWVDILTHGIAKVLQDRDCCEPTKRIRRVLDRVERDLLPALEAADQAERNYEPFRTYRRLRRRFTPVRVAKKKAAAPAIQ